MSVLGAILAGGQNRRYGRPKALARVDGERIIDRVRRALGPVADEVVLIANEPEVYAEVGLPMRPDARAGAGALGGIHAALVWAGESGHDGALVAACDMPFLSTALLDRLLAARESCDAVVPESRSRRGLEPLCAYYSVACISAIEAAIDRDDRRVIAFFDDVRVARVPLAEVERFGDPGRLFLNVNTPEERDRAETLAAKEDAADG